jgi:hypothetical protein
VLSVAALEAPWLLSSLGHTVVKDASELVREEAELVVSDKVEQHFSS